MAEPSKIKPIFKEKVDYIVNTLEIDESQVSDPAQFEMSLTQYACVHCMFNTLDPKLMNKHLSNRDHRWPWPKVDQFGNKLNGVHPSLNGVDPKKGASAPTSAKEVKK